MHPTRCGTLKGFLVAHQVAVHASSENNQTRGDLLAQADGQGRITMQLELLKPEKTKRNPKSAKEWKLVALRDCPMPEHMQLCDTPDRASEYWRMHITNMPHYDPERECFVVLFLNTRRRVRGHYLVAHGTLDTILVHPREVFRVAIVAAAAAIVLLHNLCAAAHKLCYVALRVMCSRSPVALTSRRVLQRKECCATN